MVLKHQDESQAPEFIQKLEDIVSIFFKIQMIEFLIVIYFLRFQTITEKTKLILTTKVTGIPRPKLTWYIEEIEVKQTYKTKMTYTEDVATLTITSIEKRQKGFYKCVAKNTAGSAETICQITVEG